MRDYADEVYDEVRHFHGEGSVSIAGPNTAYEIRKAIDLYRQMTDEERDMILKVRDDYQALSDLVARVKARIGE